MGHTGYNYTLYKIKAWRFFELMTCWFSRYWTNPNAVRAGMENSLARSGRCLIGAQNYSQKHPEQYSRHASERLSFVAQSTRHDSENLERICKTIDPAVLGKTAPALANRGTQTNRRDETCACGPSFCQTVRVS